MKCKNCKEELGNYADLKKRGYCYKTECCNARNIDVRGWEKPSEKELKLEEMREKGLIL